MLNQRCELFTTKKGLVSRALQILDSMSGTDTAYLLPCCFLLLQVLSLHPKPSPVHVEGSRDRVGKRYIYSEVHTVIKSLQQILPVEGEVLVMVGVNLQKSSYMHVGGRIALSDLCI